MTKREIVSVRMPVSGDILLMTRLESGDLFKRRYSGYTLPESRKKFKEELKKPNIWKNGITPI